MKTFLLLLSLILGCQAKQTSNSIAISYSSQTSNCLNYIFEPANHFSHLFEDKMFPGVTVAQSKLAQQLEVAKSLLNKHQDSLQAQTDIVHQIGVKPIRDSLLPFFSRITKMSQSEFLSSTSNNKQFHYFKSVSDQHVSLNESNQSAFQVSHLNTNTNVVWLKFLSIDLLNFSSMTNEKANLIINQIQRLPCVRDVELMNATYSFGDRLLMSRETKPLNFEFGSNETQMTPNDPLYKHQWNLHDSGIPKIWALRNDTGHGMPVAVIDSGCQVDHLDMKNSFFKNEKENCENGIDDDNNGLIDDCYGFNFDGMHSAVEDKVGHGTLTSGIPSARIDNKEGIAGICGMKCPVRCQKAGDYGLSNEASLLGVNDALKWGIKVINFSAGGPQSNIMEEAVRAARDKGTILVAASGNENCDLDSSDWCTNFAYPARYDFENIVSVGASTKDSKIKSYSNYGKHSVDVLAPAGIPAPSPTNKYELEAEGTSFSSPFVAGLIALVWGHFPDLSYKQIITALIESCTPIDDLKNKSKCGGVIHPMSFYKNVAALKVTEV